MTTLATPTTDLDQAKADLDEVGYCIVENALTPEQVAATRARLVDVARHERESGIEFVGFEGRNNQRTWALLNRGQEFCALAEHPVGLELVAHAFRRPVPNVDFLLSSITANIAGPGGPAMLVHTDQGYVPPPWPPYPLVANVMWMLDDFTEENGATRLVPGSHVQTDGGPPDQSRAKETIAATGPAGSALCFDGRMIHGTGANTTDDQYRHGILTYYCRPWIRQQENVTVSIEPELVATFSPKLRDLMGLKIFGTLGMLDGPQQRVLKKRYPGM